MPTKRDMPGIETPEDTMREFSRTVKSVRTTPEESAAQIKRTQIRQDGYHKFIEAGDKVKERAHELEVLARLERFKGHKEESFRLKEKAKEMRARFDRISAKWEKASEPEYMVALLEELKTLLRD